MVAPTDDPPYTEVLTPRDRAARGSARAPRRTSGRAPLPVAAVVAALWATALGLAPLLLLATVGTIGTGAPFEGAARIAVSVWLLGHGVPLPTGGGTNTITLIPLAVTIWAAWRLARAGVHAGRVAGAPRAGSPWPAVRAGLAVALVYAALGAGVARVVQTGISPGRAAVSCGIVAAVAAVAGALGLGRSGRLLLRRLPRTLVEAGRTALTATALLITAGALAAGVALALAGAEAAQMLSAYRAGMTGQVGITALCLIYLPNLAVWSTAYLVGPGFAVGTGTVVSPGDVLLGPVPALPVFAALPTGELTGLWSTVLFAAPAVAGLVAGALLARRRTDGPVIGAALLVGPVAVGLVQLAMMASRGGLGSGRLAELGPYDIRVALLAGGVIGVAAVLGSLLRGSPPAPVSRQRL